MNKHALLAPTLFCLSLCAIPIAPQQAAAAPASIATDAGKPVIEMHLAHSNAVRTVAISPDGKLIASHQTDTVLVWDAATGALLRRLIDGKLLDATTRAPRFNEPEAVRGSLTAP